MLLFLGLVNRISRLHPDMPAESAGVRVLWYPLGRLDQPGQGRRDTLELIWSYV